ncbi:MAG: hypothetical protein ACRC6B_07490, partial [Fusobacteriaceae bacterium]
MRFKDVSLENVTYASTVFAVTFSTVQLLPELQGAQLTLLDGSPNSVDPSKGPKRAPLSPCGAAPVLK